MLLAAMQGRVSATSQATVAIYSDRNCVNLIERIQANIEVSGCGGSVGTPPFQSALLQSAAGVSSVSVCSQGFSCDQKNVNLIGHINACVKAPSGSFDKLQLCQ